MTRIPPRRNGGPDGNPFEGAEERSIYTVASDDDQRAFLARLADAGPTSVDDARSRVAELVGGGVDRRTGDVDPAERLRRYRELGLVRRGREDGEAVVRCTDDVSLLLDHEPVEGVRRLRERRERTATDRWAAELSGP